MSKNLEILDDDDIISVLEDEEGRFIFGNTLKIRQLLKEYKHYLKLANLWNS